MVHIGAIERAHFIMQESATILGGPILLSAIATISPTRVSEDFGAVSATRPWSSDILLELHSWTSPRYRDLFSAFDDRFHDKPGHHIGVNVGAGASVLYVALLVHRNLPRNSDGGATSETPYRNSL